MLPQTFVKLLVATSLILVPGVRLLADGPRSFESGPQRTPLIELYTSEGCSSCPPADRWFSELAAEDGLWRDYVPLAFHVTYWNYLGWRDGYSDKAHDQRQRRRAAAAGSAVYTPGVFLDGEEFRGWRRQPVAPKAGDGPNAGRLRVEIREDELLASFSAPNQTGVLRLDVAVLASGVTSSVKAGENRGRSLRHDFVVTSMTRRAMVHDGDRWQARLALPPTRNVSKPALAVWVTNDRGESLQATGGWLD